MFIEEHLVSLLLEDTCLVDYLIDTVDLIIGVIVYRLRLYSFHGLLVLVNVHLLNISRLLRHYMTVITHNLIQCFLPHLHLGHIRSSNLRRIIDDW